MFDFQRVSNLYQTEFDALRDEMHKLAEVFQETRFFGDRRGFPHAHYGYLMSCMGRVDQYSALWRGTLQGDRTNQTQRMIDFLAEFVYPLPEHLRIHSIAVKMFRHSLMHTGALRLVFDESEGVAYTWRVYFGRLPDGVDHYTITDEDPKYQNQITQLQLPSGCVLDGIRAINISIPLLATGIYQGVSRYMCELRESEHLQRNYEATEAELVLQVFTHRMPSGSP